jgi:hypothetical protein
MLLLPLPPHPLLPCVAGLLLPPLGLLLLLLLLLVVVSPLLLAAGGAALPASLNRSTCPAHNTHSNNLVSWGTGRVYAFNQTPAADRCTVLRNLLCWL